MGKLDFTSKNNRGKRVKALMTSFAGLLLTISATSYAASFNCDKAQTRTEKLVCSDSTLSGLDEEMAQAYKLARQLQTDWGTLDSDFQKRWLKKRDECYDIRCMTKTYKEHLQFLNYIVTDAKERPPIAGTYKSKGWCASNYSGGISDFENWGPCMQNPPPVNTLEIKPLESRDYAVWFEFTEFASTPSYCRFAGIFSRTKDILELSEPYKTLTCKIKIRVLKDKFVFEDEGRTCHEDFCVGFNQSINEFEFPRGKETLR